MSRLGCLPRRKATQARQIFVRLRSMDELSVITLTYEVYKKVAALVTTVDKKYRYTLAEPVVESCGETLKQLILAKHAPKTHKATYLIAADASAELTALKLRALLEMNLVNDTNALKLQAKLTEARRQIGGWRKSVN
jgi:hypothetical protein